MKSANFIKLLIVSLIAVVGAVGCKKSPKGVTPIPGTTRSVPGNDRPMGVENAAPTRPGLPLPQNNTSSQQIQPSGDGTVALGERPTEGNYIVDKDMFKSQTVYFEFDSSNVRPSEQSKVQAVAAYLKSNPNNRLRIEGHCDERGTAEYNRALGERRALSVREVIVALGVPAERLDTISYGEDMPAVIGFDEAAYEKNRRAEFVLLTPKQ